MLLTTMMQSYYEKPVILLIRADELVADASLFETRLEQAGAVVAREQAFCKLGAVIRLDTQDFEWSCFDPVSYTHLTLPTIPWV